jgi:anaerobic selenocysteine-containing dehydrogenase
MSEKISRRDFLKLATAGVTGTAILTGCGPASRYIKREPYTKMPEYTYNGLNTFYATTCRECAAGCGLIVRTTQGRAIKVEGNPSHPLNRGKTCPRGQITLQGLYNPDRVLGPIKHKRGEAIYTQNFQAIQPNIEWDEAFNTIANALKDPSSVAFLMGTAPDHLFDLVTDLANGIGAAAPIRFSASSMFDTQATLSQAAEGLFGQPGMPMFDIGNADLVLSFGADFLGPWISQVSYNLAYAKLRKGNPQVRGYFIHFAPRLSQTASKADEWVPILPGTEAQVALAIGRFMAEAKGGTIPQVFAAVDVKKVSEASGVPMATLSRIAQTLVQAAKPIAVPGNAALGMSNGLSVAQAILALNALAGNFGQPGGVSLSPLAPLQDAYHRPASPKEMSDFIALLNSGKVKTLFIHGVNPIFELPKPLGFEAALSKVGTVISFATYPDETAVAADYILPDNQGLESWGYQRVVTGTSQSVLSGLQPAVTQFYEGTRPTADVLIEAAKVAGGAAAKALPYTDEVAFIQSKLEPLVGQTGGNFSAGDINTFSAYFQQYGGWWTEGAQSPTVSADAALARDLAVPAAEYAGEGEFFFVPFVSPTMGPVGANKPWLQELADPTTTVMWNSWVEINPEKAKELGIDNDDVVKITSEAGSVEVPVYLYPAIRPDVIAMPFGQGHTAFGRYAQARGANPASILGAHFNEAGDLAFAGMKVKIEKTGQKQYLSRLESRIGVYGEGIGEEGK